MQVFAVPRSDEIQTGTTETPRGLRKPSPAFVRKLKAVSPALHVAWHDQAQRWVIWERNRHGIWVEVMVVEDAETKEYRPLDDRVIRECYRGDTYRKPRGIWSVLEELQDKQRKKDEEEAKKTRHACEEAAGEIVRASAGHKTFDYGRSYL